LGRRPILVGALVLGSLCTGDPNYGSTDEAGADESAEVTAQTAPIPQTVAEDAGDMGAVFEDLTVVGGQGDIQRIPGSAHFIGEQQLDEHQYLDIHRVLQSVPGVNIQEEDGWGRRPNIGMRGTGSDRSAKITVLEDGVLAAPAPYAAPAAYYFPVAARMEAIEVLKGSSSIRQGPYTNGGVLNLVSSSIPGGDFSGRITAAAGQDSLLRGSMVVGGSKARYGWLAETYQFETDGFKDLDGGGNTGFDLGDYLLKFRANSAPDASMAQTFDIKLGYTEEFSHETYLGLTDGDFNSAPFRRYAASQQDTLDTEHKQ
jgi:Fe(3+) dicitrate transport protein